MPSSRGLDGEFVALSNSTSDGCSLLKGERYRANLIPPWHRQSSEALQNFPLPAIRRQKHERGLDTQRHSACLRPVTSDVNGIGGNSHHWTSFPQKLPHTTRALGPVVLSDFRVFSGDHLLGTRGGPLFIMLANLPIMKSMHLADLVAFRIPDG